MLRIVTAGLVLSGVLQGAALAGGDAVSRTTLGPDSALVDGAAALQAGDLEEGIRLTLQGLAFAGSRHDRAAALSNLCAGYSGIGDHRTALDFCNQSLAIRDGQWRTLQNRARVYVGLGRLDEAIADARAGLAIAPQSVALVQVLEVATRLQRQPHVIMERFP